MNDKQLFSYQLVTLKLYDETVSYILNNHELSKTAVKQIETVREYLALYEIMEDSLDRVQEICNRIIAVEDLKTVEELLKYLNDKFWYE